MYCAIKNNFSKLFLLLFVIQFVNLIKSDDITIDSTAISSQNDLFTIVGKITMRIDDIDLENTRIIADDGAYVGHLRSDGTFSISGLPSNSYVIEVSSPKNYFEPVRVDITSKGKIRARRLNLIQPSEIQTLRYPLNFESKGYPNYFQKREQFRVIDALFSPMVLMMVLPLLLIVILPKIVQQDPELERELQQSSLLQPTQNMPDLSEMAYKVFGGGGNSNARKTGNKVQGTSTQRKNIH